MVLYDLMQLSKHMSAERGYTLTFNADGKEKAFAPLDIDKTQAFLNKNGRISRNTVAGILHGVQSKRNVPMYGFVVGDDRVKISFRSKDVEENASKFVNSAVLVTGTLRYPADGELTEVSDVVSVEPFEKKMFKHMISSEKDIPLTYAIEALVSYDVSEMTWGLSYPDLGISITDQDWDSAVTGFHDYFVFLCDNYLSSPDDELSEEEIDVRDLLKGLTGANDL
jgi:hypothetical protein